MTTITISSVQHIVQNGLPGVAVWLTDESAIQRIGRYPRSKHKNRKHP